ncbi:invasion associated locus B family protein [Consotaella salsifontis]
MKFTAALLALFSTALAPFQANAQLSLTGVVRSQHGGWAVVCDTPAGAPGEQCILRQSFLAADRPEMGLTIVAIKTTDGKAKLLRVIAPLGVLLYVPLDGGKNWLGGLSLTIDGNNLGKVPFVRCFNDGCYAEVPLDSTVRIAGKDVMLEDALSNGKRAIFAVFDTVDAEKAGVGFDVDLTGFGEGFKALQ